jgi:hypothetical protein
MVRVVAIAIIHTIRTGAAYVLRWYASACTPWRNAISGSSRRVGISLPIDRGIASVIPHNCRRAIARTMNDGRKAYRGSRQASTIPMAPKNNAATNNGLVIRLHSKSDGKAAGKTRNPPLEESARESRLLARSFQRVSRAVADGCSTLSAHRCREDSLHPWRRGFVSKRNENQESITSQVQEAKPEGERSQAGEGRERWAELRENRIQVRSPHIVTSRGAPPERTEWRARAGKSDRRSFGLPAKGEQFDRAMSLNDRWASAACRSSPGPAQNCRRWWRQRRWRASDSRSESWLSLC